jgi:hypothetical protein
VISYRSILFIASLARLSYPTMHTMRRPDRVPQECGKQGSTGVRTQTFTRVGPPASTATPAVTSSSGSGGGGAATGGTAPEAAPAAGTAAAAAAAATFGTFGFRAAPGALAGLGGFTPSVQHAMHAMSNAVAPHMSNRTSAKRRIEPPASWRRDDRSCCGTTGACRLRSRSGGRVSA